MKDLLFLFLIITSAFALLACKQQRSPSRYLIPQGYVGWVRIDFDVSDAPKLQKEDGYWNFTFTDSGKIQTSSAMESGVANDEYYYYSRDGRTSLEETGWGGGGMIWAGFNGKKEKEEEGEVYQYFFVGTETQLREFSLISKDQDGHPKVGNIIR